MDFSSYELGGFYDELFESPTSPHPGARVLLEKLGELSPEELQQRHQAAELALMNMGITFNVYGNEAGVENFFPSTSFHASFLTPIGPTLKRASSSASRPSTSFSATSTPIKKSSEAVLKILRLSESVE